MALFTPEELEELRRADEELDESFVQTQEEITESRKRDRKAKLAQMHPDKRKIAACQKAYREANREKNAAYQKAYREANREKIAESKKAYYEANREKYNAYMRAYQAKRRAAAKAQ
jgi:hypothetical protein